jgi:RimJ/RimL family protein N-acetyltransferase
MDSFTTARLSAERLRRDHLDDLVPLHQDQAVSRYLGGTRTPEQTSAYIEANLAHWDQRGYGLWMLRDHDDRFVGRAGIRPLKVLGREEIEIAYTFHQPWWGQGYASEIATALCDIAFGPLGLPDLVGIVITGNAASCRVLEKAGFVLERTYEEAGHELVLYRLSSPGLTG